MLYQTYWNIFGLIHELLVLVMTERSILVLSLIKWNSKVSLLSTYISVYKLDIICLSKIYLNSEIPFDDKNLEVPVYNLVREDHPSNSKRGGVCVYYKSSLPFRVINVKYL